LMWLMLLIVQIFKVHAGFSVADVNGCIDAVGTPWCLCGGCYWLYRWCKYILVYAHHIQ